MDVFKYVKENVDIAKTCEILGIKLNKQHKAICPFHTEKTPSFSVSQSKQLWKCFGCDDGRRCDLSCIKIVKYFSFRSVQIS